jgi:DNA-binding GntR family transcriptional regulator
MPTAKTEGLMARAYQQVRQEIVQGAVAPGEPLFEMHLADRLGMSRTPVREALKVLTRDGYLEELPGRGYAVPRRSLDDMREFFELREVLEAAATRYAALRATAAEVEQMERLCERYAREPDHDAWSRIGSDFHDLVVQAARNVRLAGLLEPLNAQIVMSRRSVALAAAEERDAAIEDHQRICRAIKARDAERAQALAAGHVRRSHARTLAAYGPQAFVPPRRRHA